MKLNTPWARYLLLQGAAVLAVLLASALWDRGLGLLYVVALIVGVVLMVKGFPRGLRNGIARERLVNILVLTAVGLTIAWAFVLVAVANMMRIPSMGAAFLLLWAPPFGVFSSGTMAYLGVGPFRSRLSAMDRVRQILAENSSIQIGNAVAASQIAEAERILGLSLPRSFREFLSSWGEIDFRSTRFLGIPLAMDMAHPTQADFVGATLDGRDKLGLPRPFVLCASYPNGLHVCLDTFSMRNEEGPAVLWNGASRVLVQILAPTFADFLRDHLEASLKSSPSAPIPGP